MENTEQTKVCTRCGLAKPLSDFYLQKECRGGIRSICKTCDNSARRKRYADNKDGERETMRLYAIEHKEEISAQRKEHRAANLDKIRSAGFVYRSENKEKRRAKDKEGRRTNPEVFLLGRAKSRSNKTGIPFSIKKQDVIIPPSCPILDIPLTFGEGTKHDGSPTLDKIVPELGYVPGNVAVISHRANAIKSNGTSDEHRMVADWMEGKSKVSFRTKLAEREHAGTIITCAKKRAKQRNLPFDLRKEDILIPDVCPVLGIPIERGYRKMHDGSPTLDKIIPELGYVSGNSAIISLRANRMKNNGTAAEHRRIADWIDEQISQTEKLELAA